MGNPVEMASETSEAIFSLTNMVHKNYEHVVHDVSRWGISQMKIGFDLDGVLCDTDMNFLRLLERVPPFQDDLEKMMEFESWYFNERKPLLNPENFMSEGDEYYVIDPEVCVECEGYADEPQCAAVCPSDAVVKAE